MKRFSDWLDDRTGYRHLMQEALYENIPGGARWRYVWGSTLTFTFFVQVVTGLFLWMAYSPSARSAWESVYYIQFEMQGGWLLRGLHHYTAQAMIILLALHFAQVVIDGAYRAPREVNFWLGLLLMQIVLGLALTGYLLPWDQKGYWATSVATNLLAVVPFVGPSLQQLVVGGSSYGHATLTRFFALHAGVLPALLVVLLFCHIAVFRRHGICAVKIHQRSAAKFWPDQVLKDSVACLVVLAVVLLFTVKGLAERAEPGEPRGAHLGVELGAPADPAVPYAAARPEWYFLFLFQFLKYFHGETEVYGAIVIPGIVMGMFFLMPLFGRWRLGHGFNVALFFALLIGAGVLTGIAMQEDRRNPEYQAAVQLAEANRMRAIELAQSPTGIPESGATSLLRNDAKTQGPLLFARNCANCHSHTPQPGQTETDLSRIIAAEELSAPNLYGFATRPWIARLLDPEQVATEQHFGSTAHGKKDEAGNYKSGGMVEFVKDNLSGLSPEEQAELQKLVVALSAEANLQSQTAEDAQAAAANIIEQGKAALSSFACTDCHKFHGEGDLGTAPDLTGYGSREWLIEFISNPSHEQFYGENNDRMPAYAKDRENPRLNRLSQRQVELLADWLRGEWYTRK